MAELPPFDPYSVLEIDPSADASTIKKAFRKLALVKHPDKCFDDTLKQTRTDEFQRLNEAYDILGDEEKRKRHDALVRLEALRRQKRSSAAVPSMSTRSVSFQGVYTTFSPAFYTSRGTANVETRSPKDSYDQVHGTRYTHNFTTRATPTTTRKYSVRLDPHDEKRFGERMRETEPFYFTRRSSEYKEYSRSPEEEATRAKYETWEDQQKAHTSKETKPRSRPSISRTTSTAEVPRHTSATRSRAAPKERKIAKEDRETLQREAKRANEERKRSREREERTLRYGAARREQTVPRQAEPKIREDKEREQRRRRHEDESLRHPVDVREARRAEQTKEKDSRREDDDTSSRSRPATLQHNATSPLSKLESLMSSKIGAIPRLDRSMTMPTLVPGVNVLPKTSTHRSTPQGSKPSEITHGDSGYSSTSAASDFLSQPQFKPPHSSARSTKVTSYSYSPEVQNGSPEDKYTNETTEQDCVQPKSARGLGHNRRPSTSSGVHGGSRTLPTRLRSPERLARRDRDRNRERERECDHKREHDRDREREHDRSCEHNRTRERERESDRNREQNREREREHDHARGYQRDRQRDRHRDYDRDHTSRLPKDCYGQRYPAHSPSHEHNISYGKSITHDDIIYSIRPSNHRVTRACETDCFPSSRFDRRADLRLST